MAWEYVITENYNALTQAQSENNAKEFYDYFNGYMTIEAMAGILGNIYYECGGSINPGQWENSHGGSTNYGYGMIQWTPGTIIINWASARGANWYDGAIQVYRIRCEGEAIEGCSGTWIRTSQYNYTWDEYCDLDNYEIATRAYEFERLRGTWSEQRVVFAGNWYDFLKEISPGNKNILYGGARDMIRRMIIQA